jgi:hypothetical protein
MELAQSQERERERAHLAEADRHSPTRSDRAGDSSRSSYGRGGSVLASMEKSLRAFERHRRLIIDRLKSLSDHGERQK